MKRSILPACALALPFVVTGAFAAETPVMDETSRMNYALGYQLGRDLGLLVGVSSGANVWAARQLAEKIPGNITTVLPDRAERYFSTALM